MKSRPSGEKRRKEMQRQERNRDKAERRKTRKEEKLKQAASGTSGATEVSPDAESLNAAAPADGSVPLEPSGGT